MGAAWLGADEPAGFQHFMLRAVLCHAAYLLAPQAMRGAAITGAAAATYVNVITAMRKPGSVR